MSFESLVNIRMPEEEIFDRVAEILQRNFSLYQDVNVCLPLNPAGGKLGSVKEVLFFNVHNENDIAAKRKLMYGNGYKQVFLMTKFMNGFYLATVFGHFVMKGGDVYPNNIENLHLTRYLEDITKGKLPPFEVVFGAFDEIKQELKKKIG